MYSVACTLPTQYITIVMMKPRNKLEWHALSVEGPWRSRVTLKTLHSTCRSVQSLPVNYCSNYMGYRNGASNAYGRERVKGTCRMHVIPPNAMVYGEGDAHGSRTRVSNAW